MNQMTKSRRANHRQDERDLVFEQSLSTGILHWQELGYVDFKDLIHQTRERNTFKDDTAD